MPHQHALFLFPSVIAAHQVRESHPGLLFTAPIFHQAEITFRIVKFNCAVAPSAVFMGRKIISYSDMIRASL
jgi:hypothetical protein